METKKAELELSVIKTIMEDSRRINIDNGVHYIFWGMLVTVALLINYVMLLTKTSGQYIGLSWFILMTAGAIADVIIAKRQVRNTPAVTFAGNLLGSLWMASGIAMFIIGFVGTMTKAYNPIFISPIIATTLGISYFTSGAIQQLKWLRNTAFGWWAGGILLFIFPTVHTLLFFALMILCFQIVPGIILYRKSKVETKLESESRIKNELRLPAN